MKTWLALASVLPLVLGTSEAWAWTTIDAGNPRWNKLPVHYRINEATIPPSIAAFGKARMDQGLVTWSAPSCTSWLAQNMGNTTLTFDANDGQNVFMFRSSSWPAQLGDVGSVIGVTLPIWDDNNNMLDADIVYNNVGFCWNDTGTNNCVDTLSIVTHEEGHFLGLGHSDVSKSTMQAFYGGGNAIASIEQDDIDGVCALYPATSSSSSSSSGGASACSTCANGTSSTECKSQFQTCSSSNDCLKYYTCIDQCSNLTCTDGCAKQFPMGASLYGELIDCACTVCVAQCPTDCGGGSSSSSTGSTDTGTNENDGSCACAMTPGPMRWSGLLGVGALVLFVLRRRNNG